MIDTSVSAFPLQPLGGGSARLTVPLGLTRRVSEAYYDTGQKPSAGEVQLAFHVVDLLALAQEDEKELIGAGKLEAGSLRLGSRDVPYTVSTHLYLSAADRLRESIQREGRNENEP